MATANPVGARGPQSAILDDRRYKQYASLRDTEFTSKPPLARRLNFRRAVTQSDLHQEAERPRVGFRCTEISDAECTTPASADIMASSALSATRYGSTPTHAERCSPAGS